jgi:1,6-anhydro-N-acetylmuramate kinase
MNAHINRDLPVALVTTCSELGLSLAEASPQHAAFERVNALLSHVEGKIKRLYVTGWAAVADRLVHRLHRLDDVVAMWDVARARDAAWANGQALWALQATPPLATAFLESLDRTVGLAGRGLLVPADTVIQRIGRALR